MKYKNRWGTEEIAEYNEAVREAEAQKRVGDRASRFLAILADAIQARRPWAREVMADIQYRGAGSVLRAEERAHEKSQIAVTFGGKTLDKPRVLGVTRRNADGSISHERTLFDFMTVDELREKRGTFVRSAEAYSENVELFDRLLALCERADVETPAQAAAKLGVSVEEWLGSEMRTEASA